MDDLHILIGLGNPGSRYAKTWHNLGFMALEWLSQSNCISIRQLKHQALIGKGRMAGKPVLLVCPQTYMNESGQAVRAVLDYYRVPPQRMMVFYDDLDLAVGQIRLRAQGGAGTHNGMRSILQHLGRQDFPRFRLGIGPKPSGWDLADYVLSSVPAQQQETVFACLERTGPVVHCWLERGIEAAMQEAHRKPPVPKSSNSQSSEGGTTPSQKETVQLKPVSSPAIETGENHV